MEIDFDKLKEIGINIDDRDYKLEDPQRMFCPKCHSERKNHPTERELAVYWDKPRFFVLNCILYLP